MIQVESKTSLVNGSADEVFDYLSDFRNFNNMLPQDLISDLALTEKTCKFTMGGVGKVGLEIEEALRGSHISIKASEKGPVDFRLRIGITPRGTDQAEVRFALDASMNMFIEMVARKPLQQFADMLADKIKLMDFGTAKKDDPD